MNIKSTCQKNLTGLFEKALVSIQGKVKVAIQNTTPCQLELHQLAISLWVDLALYLISPVRGGMRLIPLLSFTFYLQRNFISIGGHLKQRRNFTFNSLPSVCLSSTWIEHLQYSMLTV